MPRRHATARDGKVAPSRDRQSLHDLFAQAAPKRASGTVFHVERPGLDRPCFEPMMAGSSAPDSQNPECPDARIPRSTPERQRTRHSGLAPFVSRAIRSRTIAVGLFVRAQSKTRSTGDVSRETLKKDEGRL